METWKQVAVTAGMFSGGLIREGVVAYKLWKQRRSQLPDEIRNAGWLITDRSLWIFEKTLLAIVVAFFLWVFVASAWFVAGMNGWIDVRKWPTPF
jgi:hypothetical protein